MIFWVFMWESLGINYSLVLSGIWLFTHYYLFNSSFLSAVLDIRETNGGVDILILR